MSVGGFDTVEVVHARAEEWADGFGTRDLVTARAIASLPVLCEYAAPLLADGGVLVAWKGACSGRGDRCGRGCRRDCWGWSRSRSSSVAARSALPERRTLHVFRKIAPTPERFPRRPGMAVKRPLA